MAKQSGTTFEARWGIHTKDLAQQECVGPVAIRLRVNNFGTPWQRRKIPTFFEKKYGRTLFEIAEERNLHPQTVLHHEKANGNAFYHNPERWGYKTEYEPNPRWRNAVQSGEYWRKQNAWLHPNHPDYERWRTGKLFPEEYVGGSKLSAHEVENMMHKYGWGKYQGGAK